jgi:hypothetical protein
VDAFGVDVAGSKSGSTVVTPSARLLSTNTGSVGMSMSVSLRPRCSASARCWLQRNPCVRIAALGAPVLPVVNVMSAGAEASTGSTDGISEPYQPVAVRPSTVDTGIARTTGFRRRRRCAFLLPANTCGCVLRTAASSRLRSAQASTNTATAPRWRTASRTS